MLTLPWVIERRQLRFPVMIVVGLGVVVQLLAISVDHQRFFFERDLNAFFWYWDPDTYFRESQLFSRPGELLSLRLDQVPETVRALRPGPYPGLVTYAPFGVSSENIGLYPIFHLPRPWPLWTHYVPERLQPVDPVLVGFLLLAIGLLGAFLLLSASKPTATMAARAGAGE
jgi:hypothetical protein